MPNFQLGKVYKLTNEIDDKIYVGSTCQSLKARLQGHKCDAKRYPNYSVYNHLNKIGWCKVNIVLLEDYPCNSEKELKFRERYYQELLKSDLNTHISILSEDERKKNHIEISRLYRQNNPEKVKELGKKRYEKNKEKWSENHKKWRQNNAEKVKEKWKIWYENNKEIISIKGKIYRQNNAEKKSEYNKKWRQNNAEKMKEDRKIWYENNKESMKAASKKYRLDNREKIKETARIKYQNNKVNCICGGSYNGSKPSMKDRHEHSEKHNKYLANNIHTLFWNPLDEILM